MSSIDAFYDDVVIDIPPGDGPDQRVALREADRNHRSRSAWDIRYVDGYPHG